jgi:AraC-like DNA-binding protein
MYRERAPRPELRKSVDCVWSACASGDPRGVLPDGMVDIVWTPGREPWVAGPDSSARPATVPKGTLQAGIRFLPGTASPLLTIPISELLDQRVPVAEFWPQQLVQRLRERLDRANGPAEAMLAFEDFVQERRADAQRPDALVAALVAEIVRSVPARPRPVRDLARSAGISERQLRRRFVAAIGYGPKVFERVMRFQHFRRLASLSTGRGLASLAADSGYADQAHLSREYMRLSGSPPSTVTLA